MTATDQRDHLAYHLRRLRLSGVLDTLDVRTQQAISEQWTYVEYLQRLLQDEDERREQKRLDGRIRRGSINTTKTLEGFDFSVGPTINRQQVLDLASCQFVHQKRNVLLCGQTGVGKTHLVQALAHEAARQGCEVLYTTADGLLRHLHAGRADGSVEKRLAAYLAPALLIIDDFGRGPMPPHGPVDLYDVTGGRYEKGSIALTSNRAPEEWAELFGDALLANAALDRLVHRATVVPIRGRSYRLAQRSADGEVTMAAS